MGKSFFLSLREWPAPLALRGAAVGALCLACWLHPARASQMPPDGKTEANADAALAAAFERCWDLAEATLREPGSFMAAMQRVTDLESRIAALVREYPDPPALIRALARSIEFGPLGGNVAHLALSGALGSVLADPVVRAATIWERDGCAPETRRRLLKLAILRGGDLDPGGQSSCIRAGHLDPAEIVTPLARASSAGEAWALSAAILDQARAICSNAPAPEAGDAAIRAWCGAMIDALRDAATPVGRFWIGWTLHRILTPEARSFSEDAKAWAEALDAMPRGNAVPRHLCIRTSTPTTLDLFWAGEQMSSPMPHEDDDLPSARAGLESLLTLNPKHPELLGMRAVVCERLGEYEAADQSFENLANILGRDLTYAEYRFYAGICHGPYSGRRLLHLLEARQAGRRGRAYREMVPELYCALAAHVRFDEARALIAEGPPWFKTAMLVTMSVPIALAGALVLVMAARARRKSIPFPTCRQAAVLTGGFTLINAFAAVALGIWLGFIAAALVVVGAYILMKERPGPDAEGFRWPGYVGAMLLPAAVVVGGVAVDSAWGLLLRLFGVEPRLQLVAEALRGQEGTGVALAAAAVVVAAPVAEEVLFRRMWFPVLRRSWP